MIVTGPTAPRPPVATARARSVTGFTLPEPAAAEPATPEQAAVTTTAGVDGASLLALQEQPAPRQVRDRAARGACARLLAALTRLQRSLLGGGTDAATDAALADLTDAAAAPAPTDDPLLRAALDAAMLRARVELARHGSPPPSDARVLPPPDLLSTQDALSTERPTPSCLI